MFPSDPHAQAQGEREVLRERIGLYFSLRHEDPLARLRVRSLLALLRLTEQG